ncbi:hypothetical protein IMZ48_38725 [Candidatus Bathyarchaeota archaeon]|nr:hypothetical protein [Candidatus Bathyarchaeota archaeon]
MSASQNTACRCLPTEPCWPSNADWQSLNDTVNGQLSRVSPLGAVCHDPTYDEEACGALLSGAAYNSSLRAATPGMFPYHLHSQHQTDEQRRRPVAQLGSLGSAQRVLLRRDAPLRAL